MKILVQKMKRMHSTNQYPLMRTSVAKRQLANDEKDPRHGKEQVKPLARANVEKDDRDRHKQGEYEQRVGKVRALPGPQKWLQLMQRLESVRASLERHGGRVRKERALQQRLDGEEEARHGSERATLGWLRGAG